MTNDINLNKAGLTVGAFLGLFHAGWSVLIVLGWAQPLLDFIFNLHMINPVYSVLDFNIITAVLLILVTSIIGYVCGVVFAALWNYLHR